MKPIKPKGPDLAEQLRAAIVDSGKTAYLLSQETGVPQQTIDAFLQGRDLRLSRAGLLAAALKLKLR